MSKAQNEKITTKPDQQKQPATHDKSECNQNRAEQREYVFVAHVQACFMLFGLYVTVHKIEARPVVFVV